MSPWTAVAYFARLGPPAVPFYKPFFGEGSPTIQKKVGTLILISLLEDLADVAVVRLANKGVRHLKESAKTLDRPWDVCARNTVLM